MTAPRTPGFAFRVDGQDGHARTGVLTTPHGDVPTPTFMPVGTQGTVKTLTPDEVASTGARVVLGNTYHLWLRPGPDTVAAMGGLGAFTRWPHATLTDSGGFQAFSLAGRRATRGGLGVSPRGPTSASAGQAKRGLVTPSEDGFTFQSHLDGTRMHLSPEEAVRVQGLIGADIQMQLDVCPPGGADRSVVEAAVAQTTRWAKRALAAPRPLCQALFGIVQGGCDPGLRRAHAEELAALDPGFDGLALGGFSVGEPIERMHETLAAIAGALDAERPRYLMGVGTPKDLLVAIEQGVDMFDCAMPTRNARNGQAFTREGRVVIKQARYARDPRPIDPGCACACCAGGFSRAYLRHLYLAGEITVLRLLSLHNLQLYGDLVREARAAIQGKRYAAWKSAWEKREGHEGRESPQTL
jgi:queuine tRNA-ribosyltransferase